MRYILLVQQLFFGSNCCYRGKNTITYRLLSGVYKNKYLVALLIFLVILLAPQLSISAYAPIDQSLSLNTIISRSDTENYYLQAINSLRAQYNHQPLLIDNRLSQSAHTKGVNMVKEKYWGHFAPNGQSFADFIWAKSPKAEFVGENLAKCFNDRQSAFEALRASLTHLSVMVGEFTNFGVAEVYDTNRNCTYTVMHFAYYLR